MRSRRTCRGFSLYELVMTLAIAALVLTVGVPSFGGLIADKRLRAESDALFHAFHLARTVSIAQRTPTNKTGKPLNRRAQSGRIPRETA